MGALRDRLNSFLSYVRDRNINRIHITRAAHVMAREVEEIAEANLAAITKERDETRKIAVDLLAHLNAATSLLEAVPATQKGRVKAPMAPSDAMFRDMLADYKASIARGRAYLKGGAHE